MNVRIPDAGAFEKPALFENAGDATAALRSLPRVTPELGAVKSGEPGDEPRLQALKKTLDRG